MSANVPVKFNRSWEGVLDCDLANPEATLGDISKLTGYSVPWLSVLMRSSAYLAEKEKRRKGIVERIETGIVENIQAAAIGGLIRVGKLIDVSDSLTEVGGVTTKLLDALGYSPRGIPGVVVNNNTNVQNNVVNGQMPESVYARARNNYGKGQQNANLLSAPESGFVQEIAEGEIIDGEAEIHSLPQAEKEGEEIRRVEL